MSVRSTALEDVCSLDEMSLQERLDFIRREVAPHVVCREHSDDGAAWEFDESPAMRDTLEGLIELERDCCATWRFELGKVPDSNRMRLSVEGDGAGSALLEVLSDGLDRADAKTPPTGTFGRLLRAGGLGFLASFAVCCLLPLALAGVFGGTVLAAAAVLDTPLAIAIATLIFGAVFWRWQSRRRDDR